jgi:uncharacterized protein
MTMDLDELTAALTTALTPDAIIQTHISVVFLVGREVFKIHKPVEFGFLDFRLLEQRRRDCEAEVEVNAELAPGVYRGLAAIVEPADHPGRLAVEREPSGELEPIEWAVWMRRLPESATLRSQLERRALGRETLAELALTLADFYDRGAARAAAEPELCRLGDLATVRANVEENFAQLDALVHAALDRATSSPGCANTPAPVDPGLLDRLRAATEAELDRIGDRIHARYEAGAIRDTHGDLRLDHVYELDHLDPSDPDDRALVDAELQAATGGRSLLIIDRIEFNDRFRWADPISDVAFLRMDLEARGAWQLAAEFTDDFIAASDDPEGAALLRFYAGYRATVRAKIAAMTAAEPEQGPAAQAAARAKAAARIRLALAELEVPERRPCLVLVGGLPGTGKSALAAGLSEAAGLSWVRADAVRKQLAGIDPLTHARSGVDEGLYSPAWTDQTYAACLARAGEICEAGGRALVDATFLEHHRRERFVAAAIAWGVPTLLLLTSAPPELVRSRLASRDDDPSDATWTIYEAARDRWRPADPQLCRVAEIDTCGTPAQTLAEAVRVLAAAGLTGPWVC